MFPNDLIDDAVILALLGIHDEITFYVLFDFFQFLAGMLGHNLVHDFAHPQGVRQEARRMESAGQTSEVRIPR